MLDVDYMRLALTLAERGRLTARPNPMVGAVIVKDGRIVGCGFHVRPGEVHAEVAAIHDANCDIEGSTVFVNLEPCSFTGRTPPCADALIDQRVARVVCAIVDPNACVSGGGVERLRDVGIDVEVGTLAAEAERLNAAYLTHRHTGRPYVSLKWAQSLDGTIATTTGDSKWITGKQARARAHALRAEAQAVVVGVDTVVADNPALTVRHVSGEDPTPVILDSTCRTPPDAAAIRPGETIVATTVRSGKEDRGRLEAAGAEVLVVEENDTGRLSISRFLRALGERGLVHVLVEGGSRVAAGFLSSGCADRLVAFVAPRLLGTGITSVADLGIRHVKGHIPLSRVETVWAGDDLVYTADIGALPWE